MHKNKTLVVKKLFLIIALSSFIYSTYAEKSESTANTLLHNISINGSTTVVNTLINAPKKWNFILNKIATGNENWLNIADKLKPLISAANAEELNFSVAKALAKNPRNVVEIIGKNFSVSEVCVSPFIEGDPKVEIRFLKSAIKSVSNLHDNNLQKIKDACLNNLNLYLEANKKSTVL